MFHPETAGPHTPWTADAACFVCSFWMDNFNGITVHLNHRDITMAAVSRAPYPKLAAYKKRMGWSFKWVSSFGNEFNRDYHVSFTKDEMDQGRMDYNYGTDGFPREGHGSGWVASSANGKCHPIDAASMLPERAEDGRLGGVAE